MTDRTRIPLLCALAAGLLLAGCGRYHRFAAATEVVEAADALVRDYNAQDATAAAAWDAPDYVGVFHGTPNTVGPAADLAGMKSAMAASKVHWEIGRPNVTLAEAGDIGIFEAPYSFTMTGANGALSRESGTWIAIFKRQADGKLKLWRSIGSDTPLAKPSAS